MPLLLIFIGLPALAVVFIIFSYNRLVTLKHRANEAWADIEVQLKRRYNLIPNLVETVKGYATHERGVFESVTKARAAAVGAKTMEEHGKAENLLTGALKTLFAVSENYPQLRASENFMELQRELRDAEDKIQAARRFYNANVRDLGIATEAFPTNIIAGIFGFKKMGFFEIQEPAARAVPEVKF